MTDSFDDLFGNEPTPETVEANTEVAAPAVENTETVEATAEAKADVETPKVETEAPAVEPETEKRTSIPLDVLLEERAKRQEAQKRLEEYERKEREALEAKANRPAEIAPDPIDDPQGYTAYVIAEATRLADEKVFAYRLHVSEEAAKKVHGEEAVKTAAEWFAEQTKVDPSFSHHARSQADPVEWVVQQHRRHALFTEFQTNPDEVIRREAARLGLVATATAASATVATVTPNGSQVAAQRSVLDGPSATARTSTTGSSSDPFDSFL